MWQIKIPLSSLVLISKTTHTPSGLPGGLSSFQFTSVGAAWGPGYITIFLGENRKRFIYFIFSPVRLHLKRNTSKRNKRIRKPRVCTRRPRGTISFPIRKAPGYLRRWSGTATSCAASWTRIGSSSGPPHSGKLWSWSPPSPSHLCSAHGMTISQRGEWSSGVNQLSRHCHNYVPSWLHWVCWQSRAVCSGSTPLWRDVWRWAVFSVFRKNQGIFCCITQSKEGFLQISFHLLPDALLDVIWTVALVPLKHCETQWAGYNLCDIFNMFNRKHCL